MHQISPIGYQRNALNVRVLRTLPYRAFPRMGFCIDRFSPLSVAYSRTICSRLESCNVRERGTRVIDLRAGQREGENFVAKMQRETKSRQARGTWHDDSLLEAPTTVLKSPVYLQRSFLRLL